MNRLFSPREELALLATIIHASRSVRTGTVWRKGDPVEETLKSEARNCVGMALAIIVEAEKIAIDRFFGEPGNEPKVEK